ncbi:hypothetical protein BAL199_15598 [alpha proteobacterium BAL199]|jgi:uncharacterized protein (DUF983 family)|nr:hypothetical protein BAL199_15598 [alpha proteobacterium BAL199]
MSDAFGPPPSPFVTGLRGRCPQCGVGRLFDGYLSVREICESCGAALSEHDTGDGPAVFVIFILGAAVVPLALAVEAAFGPPMWLHAVLWSAVILGGTLALLRRLKGVMVALHYRHRGPGS